MDLLSKDRNVICLLRGGFLQKYLRQQLPVNGNPPPIKRQSLFCLPVAVRRRGNHSKGTETSCPSARNTCKESAVKDTSTASGPIFTVKCSCPFSSNNARCSSTKRRFSNFVTAKAKRWNQRYGIQPEFCIFSRLFKVNIWHVSAGARQDIRTSIELMHSSNLERKGRDKTCSIGKANDA